MQRTVLIIHFRHVGGRQALHRRPKLRRAALHLLYQAWVQPLAKRGAACALLECLLHGASRHLEVVQRGAQCSMGAQSLRRARGQAHGQHQSAQRVQKSHDYAVNESPECCAGQPGRLLLHARVVEMMHRRACLCSCKVGVAADHDHDRLSSPAALADALAHVLAVLGETCVAAGSEKDTDTSWILHAPGRPR